MKITSIMALIVSIFFFHTLLFAQNYNLSELEDIDKLLFSAIKTNNDSTKKDYLEQAARKLQYLLSVSESSDDFYSAVHLRREIISTIENIPPNKRIEGYDMLRLINLAMEQVSNLMTLKIKRDSRDFHQGYIAVGNKEALQGIYDIFWNMLEDYAAINDVSLTGASLLKRNEVIIGQFVGPSEGKITIMEMIGDRNTKTCKWKEAKFTPIKSNIIQSDNPVCFYLGQKKRPLVMVIDGKNLAGKLESNMNWLQSVSMSVSIILREQNKSQICQLHKLFCDHEIYIFSLSDRDSEKIWLVDAGSASKIGEWKLTNFINDRNGQFKNFVEQLIATARHIRKSY
jgi:hypothetical protein